ncbi:MAG: Gfo/Idh/MocA family oxidoreductase [Actinoplanes sp.]
MHEPFAAEAAKRYGFSRTETDWRAVIDAPDVDAVSVAVANNLHREIVEATLAAGKHVLCEKPLAPSVDDAQHAGDAALGTGRTAAANEVGGGAVECWSAVRER